MIVRKRQDTGNLKEEAPGRTLWTSRFGRGYGPAVIQTTERMNMKHE